MTVIALGALATLGALYSKLTVAAPGPEPAAIAAAMPVRAPLPLPASRAATTAAPIVAATSPEVARLDGVAHPLDFTR